MSKNLFAALALFLFTTSLFASQQNLRVGVAGQPPFLNMESVPGGAAMDIWEKVAAENGWGFSCTRFDTIKNGLKAIADGSVDILVGDIPITKENLAQAEFSQPFFHSGLQILIADNQRTVRARLASDIKDLVKLEIFWIILACIVVLSTTVYLFERKHNPEFPTGRQGRNGRSFLLCCDTRSHRKIRLQRISGRFGTTGPHHLDSLGNHFGSVCDIEHYQRHDGGKTVELG